AARLHHTNIVPVFGVGEQDGLHYYVMQFIPGLGLDQVLTELRRLRRAPAAAGIPVPAPGGTLTAPQAAAALHTGRFARAGAAADGPAAPTPPDTPEPGPATAAPGSPAPIHLPGQGDHEALPDTGWRYWRSVARIGLQVAEALAHANSQGVLHRDVKPSNLLLDGQGTVWVTDFGLAKAADSDELTRTGDLVGTLRYMAPERFRGQSDARSDIYSLGLTLYELLTLQPAFDDADRGKLMRRVLDEEPPRPRRLNP